MAHTDRDDERIKWRRHWCSDECAWQRRPLAHSCEICDLAPWPYRAILGPIADPEWRRDCRREERARTRNIMQRARSGHLDWDDLTIAYRRPYYW